MSITESVIRRHQILQSAALNSLKSLKLNIPPSLTPISTSYDRVVFCDPEMKVIAKVYDQGNILKHEFNMLTQAEEAGVPVPHVFGFTEGKPAVLVTQMVQGSKLSSANPNSAREAGMYLRRFHELKAKPPFAEGQETWQDYVLSRADRAIDWMMANNIPDFRGVDLRYLRQLFLEQKPNFTGRPVKRLHGDFQPNHVLIDPTADKVMAFIDFADAQPGDPLWDVAVVSLWDKQIADLVLGGYNSEVLANAAKGLLPYYRLLRHLVEIPWRFKRGRRESDKSNLAAIQGILKEELP